MIPNRIELAARAMFQNDTVWEALTEGAKRAWMDFAAKGLKAAFPDAPGLFDDPPQVWLAPWELTEAMWPSVQADIFFERTPEELWRGARFAHLHLASQSDNQEGDAK